MYNIPKHPLIKSDPLRSTHVYQLMVGSRYHELIESADSIVSMKEISSEVLALLQDFPHACSKVLQQVRRMRGK